MLNKTTIGIKLTVNLKNKTKNENQSVCLKVQTNMQNVKEKTTFY